ncbi:MAG: tetratricopeptide repeat protein [Acidobacteriota bacterium]
MRPAGRKSAANPQKRRSQPGEPRRAIEFHHQALVVLRKIGDRRSEGNVLGNLGTAYAVLSEPRRAIECYEQHLAIAREIGDRRGEGRALANLGRAYGDLGDSQRASACYTQSLAIGREIGDPRIVEACERGLKHLAAGA